MKFASKYEISIESKSKKISKKSKSKLITISAPNWNGDLNFGQYEYQIRAIDKLDRPGQWSSRIPLIVMPGNPELKQPESGEESELFDPNGKVRFSWEPVPEVNQYKIIIKNKGKTFIEQITSGPEIDLSIKQDGEYEWTVVPSFGSSEKNWDGKATHFRKWTLKYSKLAAPKIVGPVGLVRLSKDTKYTFEWKKVEGAQEYLIKLKPIQLRGPASQAAQESSQSIRSKNEEVEVSIQNEGLYSWEVQALAGVDSNGTANAESSSSVAKFNIVPPSPFREGKFSLEATTLAQSLSVNSSSTFFNLGAGTRTSSFGVNLRGEYFFKNSLGMLFGFRVQGLSVRNENTMLDDMELGATYRVSLPQSWWSLLLQPKLGLSKRGYVSFLPWFSFDGAEVMGVNKTTLTAWGPVAGLSVRKRFGDSLFLGLVAEYYYPMGMMGGPDQSTGLQGSSLNFKNYLVGVNSKYWLSPRFALLLQAQMANRAVAFSNMTGLDTIEISTVGASFGFTYVFQP